MKHRLFSLLLVLIMAATLFPPVSAVAEGGEQPVLVGLVYGDDALPGANLANQVGTGYRFGYLDGSRNFCPLGYTEATAISVAKTQNVWYGLDPNYSSTLKSYSDAITSDIAVGCWHVYIPTVEELLTFEDTLALAREWGGFPAWIKGTWQVRLGAYTTQEEAQAAAELVGGGVVGTSSYGVSVIQTGTASILFQFDGGEAYSLTVAPGMDDSVKPVTYFKGNRYYGLFRFQRINGGNLTVVNAVPLDDYTECVISREMSSSWPLEALKAQAVCARNYYDQNHTKTSGRHKAHGFDICSTTDCQAYEGMANTNERTAQAVAETSGLRVYYQGKLAEVFYFASDGGATEDIKNVWGSTGYPYLCGVVDPYEATVSDRIAYWDYTQTFTARELTELLQGKGYSNTDIVDIQLTFTELGNVKTLTFIDANGKSYPFVRQGGVRDLLKLKSMRYTVTKSGGTSSGVYYTDGGGTLSSMNNVYAIDGNGRKQKLSGNIYVLTSEGTAPLPEPYGGTATSNEELVFTFHSSGNGHNLGMSQWGAYAMAQQGFTFDQILMFYFPGTEVY